MWVSTCQDVEDRGVPTEGYPRVSVTGGGGIQVSGSPQINGCPSAGECLCCVQLWAVQVPGCLGGGYESVWMSEVGVSLCPAMGYTCIGLPGVCESGHGVPCGRCVYLPV